MVRAWKEKRKATFKQRRESGKEIEQNQVERGQNREMKEKEIKII